MLSEETQFVDYLFYASLLPGLALVVLGALNSQMRLLLYIGIAIPGMALAYATSEKIPIKFEVMVVRESDGGMTTELTKQFVGGSYTFSDGRTEPVSKPGVKQVETVLINDSPRPLNMSAAIYTASSRASPSGGRENVGTIAPGGIGHVPSRHIFTGPQSDGPPKSIEDKGVHDVMVYWVYWK